MRQFNLFFLLLICSSQLFGQNKKENKPSSKPFVLGVTEELESSILSEKRMLNIYLPEGYKANDTVNYNVIYLLDGSADEDFIHVAGLVQFNSFEWINRMPKTILVGIANVDRKRDFTFSSSVEEEKKKYPTTGQSEKFISFIEKELQPYIQKKYRCTLSKTIIGQSLGGLLATEILLKKPALFNKYIIISPSLWWSDGVLLKQPSEVLNSQCLPNTKIYIGVGKEGVTPSPSPHVMEVDANLLAEKITNCNNKNLSVNFDYLPNENHATIGHIAVFNAFRLLFPAQ